MSRDRDALELFYAYAPQDEALRQQLANHLTSLQRQGLIRPWHERDISAGSLRSEAIDRHLQAAQLILLLISPDFMASDYYGILMQTAMQLHEAGAARVIPILLRPCDLQDAPFSKLQVLPRNAEAVTTWTNQDAAFAAIAKEIRAAINEIHNGAPATASLTTTRKKRSRDNKLTRSTPKSEANETSDYVGSGKRPISYFPYGHNTLFKPRKGEFEALEPRLRAEDSVPVRLGLVGVGGVGKSGLARELVYRNEAYFTDGVFWVAAGKDHADETRADRTNSLIYPLATLANKLHFLPPGGESTLPNEEQRARHLCRFLAQHPRALLILDNLEDPDLLTTALPDLAGSELRCAVLYTSRSKVQSHGIHIHIVKPLSNEQDQLALLLEEVRPAVLERVRGYQRDEEVVAARSICLRVGGLVLALTLLRSQLEQNGWLTLSELDQQLSEHGVLAVARDESAIHKSLEATFYLSWQHVSNELAQRMFQLAAYFPAATPIPLWLLSLACAVDEDYALHSPLMEARRLLQRLSLIEDVSRQEVQMHPLLHIFGQRLLADAVDGPTLRTTTAERVIAGFEDVCKLEQCVRERGFWDCLCQIRAARIYIASLQPGAEERLRRVERRLDQETYFLATSGLWPQQLPGLFYQQMYNHILEEGQPLPASPSASPWLRQLERVGIRDTGLIRVFSGHSKGVNSVAFSPDGTKVLTGSEDCTARIFETTSGKTLHVLSGHNEGINSVAYSPDGTCVLTGSKDHTARLWDVESGECIRILEGHTDWVNAVAFSPDGRLIATGSQDGMVRLWECSTGQVYGSFSIRDVRRREIVALNEGRDIAKYIPLAPYPIRNIVFSPEATVIALATHVGTVFLWNFADDTCAEIPRSALGAMVDVIGLAYSADGHKLLIGGRKHMMLWDCRESTPIKEFHDNVDPLGISSIAFSYDPAGSYILSGSWTGIVHLFETCSGKLIRVSERHVGTINSAAFSPDDTAVLLGSSNGTAQLWHSPHIYSNSAEMVHISPNSNTQQSTSMPESYFAYANFSPDGSYLLTNSTNNTFCLWDVQSRQRLLCHNTSILAISSALSGQPFSPASTFMIASATEVRLLSKGDGECLQEVPIKGNHLAYPAYEAVFSRDGRYLLSGAPDLAAYLWSTSSGKIIQALGGHSHVVDRVAISSDSQMLLTGSLDGAVRLWKRQGRKYIPGIFYKEERGVRKLAFSPDGKQAFIGLLQGLLCIWDTANGDLLSTLNGQMEVIWQIACSPDGKYILAGDMFNQVRIWQCEEPFALVGAFSTHGKLLAAHWRDERTILLVDDAPTDGFPRMYTLNFSGG